jgi:hypothetical protein
VLLRNVRRRRLNSLGCQSAIGYFEKMRLLLIAACALGLAAAAFLGVRVMQYSLLFPPPSTEVVLLTPEKELSPIFGDSLIGQAAAVAD